MTSDGASDRTSSSTSEAGPAGVHRPTSGEAEKPGQAGKGRDGGDGSAPPPAFPVDSVLVVGLGLMGGSLARTLRRHPSSLEVLGLTLDGSDAEAALAEGAVTEVVTETREALGRVDLVVYATPLSAVLDLLEEHGPHLGADTLLTDVASLKAPVVERVRALDLDDRFVGSHPMTGGEGSGFRASRPGIYRGSTVFLTDDTGTKEARDRVETFWQSLGGRTVWIGAHRHDQRMAWVSHLPQLLANGLARALEEAGMDPSDLGPGGRDMTRLAASSPEMWRDLVTHAGTMDARALRIVADEISKIAGALEQGRVDEVVALLDRTRQWRLGGRGS